MEPWFSGSDRNFAAKHPQGKPKAWRIWAPTPKTPASEFRGIAAVRADPSIPQDRVRKRIEAFFLNQTLGTLPCSDAALSPRRATHFLLLRQEKVSKEKATLVPASLRCATGNLRCSLQAGARTNSPSAQTSARPDPLEAPLLGAFTRGGETNSESGSGTGSRRTVAIIFIASHAGITWSGGQKHLGKGRTA